ncbi:MAG: AAA family ATPase [Gammaproteobacteria bacterium]|nr:AAA family ATPase [Gammaproteobacteria bacterium]MDH5735030.1 AAA family ATPase [Gammaproteobacteria bacterium]
MAKKEQPQQKLVFSANALEAMGLSKQPFISAVLSDNEIYLDSVITQLIASLNHHMQFSPLLLIVEGPYGSGKTTLFRYISQSDITNIKLLPVHAEASDTLVQLQHKMSFHLQDLGDANHLDDNLKHLKTFDNIPVLVIDDAHTLSDTVLQELFRYKTLLQQEKEIELKILLIANPGMSETIEKISGLQHNQLYVQTMPVFTDKQILNFCQHRLLSAGYSGQPLLDKSNAQLILKKSNGIPGAILEIALKVIEKNLKKKTKSERSINKLLIPAAALLLISIGAGVFFLISTQPDSSEPVKYTAPVMEKTKPAPLEPHTKPKAITQKAVARQQASEQDMANTEDETRTAPALEKSEPLTDSDALQSPEQPAQPETPDQPPSPSIPVIPEPPEEPEIAVTTTPLVSDNAINLPDEKTDTLVASTALTNEPKKTLKKAAELDQVITETKPVIKTKPAITSAPTSHPALSQLAALGMHDKNWLLKQNSGHWTLQVLGARDPDTLVNFARLHKLGEDSAWYETQLSGNPWYIIVYRFYTDKEIARKSIDRLPVGLRQAKPWVKNIGDIHKAIK